jgi:hypothetical protein
VTLHTRTTKQVKIARKVLREKRRLGLVPPPSVIEKKEREREAEEKQARRNSPPET